jgi:uncharacterized protein (DUF1800 family)
MTPIRALALCAALAAAATLPLAPAAALDADEARHFLLRTGFGATPDEVRRLAPMRRAEAVDDLLARARREPATPPPDFMAAPRPDWLAQWRSKDDEAKFAFNRARDAEFVELKAWWWREMVATPSPFGERMTLFWHGHFTSGFDKVRDPTYMFRQNLLLRREGLGSFRELTRAVARDPAMVRYLDSSNNRKGGANENFARELLELYTLGEGEYTEADVKQAARAFTGWHNDEAKGEFRFNKGQHDDGEKTFLGRTGRFDGDQIVAIVFEQKAAATFVTRRLWREFVSDRPDEREVERLAATFRAADFSVAALLRALLLSDAFWAPANRGTLVKSPVELLVGAVRQFAPGFDDPKALAEYGKRMRQDLFNPPNVRGWPGGTWWISTETLLVRREALARLVSGVPADRVFAPDAPRLLLAVAPVVADPAAGGRAGVEALVLDPAYQVK